MKYLVVLALLTSCGNRTSGAQTRKYSIFFQTVGTIKCGNFVGAGTSILEDCIISANGKKFSDIINPANVIIEE